MQVVSFTQPHNITSEFLVCGQDEDRYLFCVTIHCLEVLNISTGLIHRGDGSTDLSQGQPYEYPEPRSYL
jgi:hypothetical protein